jgi:hypothetical protein
MALGMRTLLSSVCCYRTQPSLYAIPRALKEDAIRVCQGTCNSSNSPCDVRTDGPTGVALVDQMVVAQPHTGEA